MGIRTLFLLLVFILSLHAAERVVSLSPSITEILFALGIKPVATSEYSLYPKEARLIPVIGGYSHPNLERIVSFSPSIVIGQEFNSRTMQELGHFQIPTLILRLQTIQDIKTSIKKLSEYFHTEGSKLIGDINDALQDAAKSDNPHSVLIVFGLYEDLKSGIYIAGDDIFFNDIILACGNTNAYQANLTQQPVLNYENVIALNPDQIIILHSNASNPHVDKKKALQNWYALPTNASKNKKITVVDESYINIPSQRIALTIRRLAKEMNRD